MEIGLFSKCIRSLMESCDRIAVPGLGVFFAETVPAAFSDTRSTINPPSRKMYFEKTDISAAEGELLYGGICELMGVGADQAPVELSWCLGRLRSELDGNRICVLPGLGVMKSTSDSDYFFVPDDDLDISPEFCGLEPVSVKIEEPVAEPVPEPVPEPIPEPVPESHRGVSWTIIVVAIIILLAIAAVVIVMMFPDLLDKLLYSPEERELLGI